jgi:hypothetical protein
MTILRAAGWAGAALVCGVLIGCAAKPGYVNTVHPEYGAAQQDADLAQCRKQNTQVVSQGGYAQVTQTKVDEPAVQTCMTTLGWQPAKP